MSHFLHSEAWQRLLLREGLSPLRQDNQLYTIHGLPFGKYIYGTRLTLDAGYSLPKLPEQPIFIRLEPIDENSLGELRELAGNKKLISTYAIQPRQTSIVDITLEPNALLTSFESKHRYNIRLAERKGVEVHFHGPEALSRFLDLLEATAKRQNFRIHSTEHYKLMAEELAKDGMFHVGIASLDGIDLAGMLLINCGDTATYLHGASSDTQKNLMAPHLLHWQAIQYAKTLGCTEYDLWGTHAVWNGGGHWEVGGGPSAGVTRFKLGFNGRIVEYPGAYDLILQPFWYTAYTTLRRLRSAKRAFS